MVLGRAGITTDQGAAKEFYSGLFGWEAEDLPVGDGVSYSMMRLGARDYARTWGLNSRTLELLPRDALVLHEQRGGRIRDHADEHRVDAFRT